MLIRAAAMGANVPYTELMGKGSQQGHNNKKFNLNMDAQQVINQGGLPKKVPEKGINQHETILPEHRKILSKFLKY